MNFTTYNRILSTCLSLEEHTTKSKISLVTEDRNLRLKARFFGIKSEGVDDYVREGDACKGVSCIEGVPEGILRELFESSLGVDVGLLDLANIHNKHYILKNGSTSVLTRVQNGALVRVQRRDVMGISPRNVEQTLAISSLMNPSIPLVAITGKAGTGKTLLAMASAIEQRSLYRQILVSRPVVPLGGKDLGYLPGDIKEKLAPYMQPIFDNLSTIRRGGEMVQKKGGEDIISKMLETGKIVVEPLSYIRGRSLHKVLLLVDEAQNLTRQEVKAIVTRAGEGTKVLLTGDVEQIDTPGIDKYTNGLSYSINKLYSQPLFSHVQLLKSERSPLAELTSTLL